MSVTLLTNQTDYTMTCRRYTVYTLQSRLKDIQIKKH